LRGTGNLHGSEHLFSSLAEATFVPLPAIAHEEAFGRAPKAAREGACAPQSPVSDVLARIGG